jgi:hypothetical protein
MRSVGGELGRVDLVVVAIARVWDATSPYHRWGSLRIGAECDAAESLAPDQRFVALSCRTMAPASGTPRAASCSRTCRA